MSESAVRSKVHVVARTSHHFVYLVAPAGGFLASADGRSTLQQDFVDDAALWDAEGDGFRHVVTGLTVLANPAEAPDHVRLSLAGAERVAQNGPGLAATFRVAHGPAELPSAYLETLRAQGWVALTCILDPAVLDGLQKLGGVDAYEGAEAERGEDRGKHLVLDPAMARSTVEPLSLWLCRQYLRVDDIKLGHPPSVTALTPDDGERAVQGWHGDFPYMWGSDRSAGGYRVPTGASEVCLALQRNICVSDFRAENGATVFKLESHRQNTLPPAEWGRANRTYRPGDRQQNGLPYGGEETDILEAPAGTIILSDARTWHRAGMNHTNRRRGAVIQAVTPGFIMPFMDNSAVYKAFLASAIPAQLTERERVEMENLMVHRIVGPAGISALSPDEALTPAVRARAKAGRTPTRAG